MQIRMKSIFWKVTSSISVALSLGLLAVSPAQASPVLGSLTNGVSQESFATGWWSFFVNTNDVVTVTARNLDGTDLSAAARDGVNGTGNEVGFGSDELPDYSGISQLLIDPQFTFTALTTGEYSLGVFDASNLYAEDLPKHYFLSATIARGNNVPEPGTIALLGLGLIGIVAARKLKKV